MSVNKEIYNLKKVFGDKVKNCVVFRCIQKLEWKNFVNFFDFIIFTKVFDSHAMNSFSWLNPLFSFLVWL